MSGGGEGNELKRAFEEVKDAAGATLDDKESDSRKLRKVRVSARYFQALECKLTLLILVAPTTPAAFQHRVGENKTRTGSNCKWFLRVSSNVDCHLFGKMWNRSDTCKCRRRRRLSRRHDFFDGMLVNGK